MADDMMAVPVPSEELEHYGIKGMSWYKHIFGEWQKQAQYANGMDDPDAPEKKTRAERRAEAYEEGKQRALQSGSATDILKYKGDLTNQEMQAAVNRLNLERQLSEVMAKENYVKTGWDKADEIFDKVGKVGNYVGNTANLIGNTNRLISSGKELLDFAKGLTKSGKEKREAIEKGDLDDIKKHINEFSTKEREDIAKRLKFEDNINERLANRKPPADDEDKKPEDDDPIETMNDSQHNKKTDDNNNPPPPSGGSGSGNGKTNSVSESFHKTVDKGRQEEANKQKTAREKMKEQMDETAQKLMEKELAKTESDRKPFTAEDLMNAERDRSNRESAASQRMREDYFRAQENSSRAQENNNSRAQGNNSRESGNNNRSAGRVTIRDVERTNRKLKNDTTIDDLNNRLLNNNRTTLNNIRNKRNKK